MNVYDFDDTIYDGESIVDFFLFMLKKKAYLALYFPLVAYSTACYKMGLLSVEDLYPLASKFSSVVMKNKENAEELIREFWEKHEHKLKPYYLEKLKEDDVIITASPRILIEGIKEKLNTKNIICSEFNLDSGNFDFICFGENKVKAFLEQYPNAKIEEFYTDSLYDSPLMNLANQSYLVKRNKHPRLLNPEKQSDKKD